MVQPLRKLTAAHHGLYWQLIRDEFPISVDQPGLDTVFETEAGPQVPVFALRLGPPPLRSFFVSADEETLIQVQVDRFFNNWRRGVDGQCPHFDELADAFLGRWQQFRDFVDGEDLGPVAIDQVEVTYVNLVDDGTIEGDLGVVGPASLHLAASPAGTASVLEEQQLALRYRLQGEPLARLHVALAPRTEGWTLELNVRSKPSAPNGLAADLQRARIAIDAAFTGLTSQQAHERWGIITT